MTEDRRLLDEIGFLSDQLAHVLNEQAPPRVAQAVARLRRGTDADRVLAGMDDSDLPALARALSMLLDLTNLAEDRQRVRVLRDRERRRGNKPLEGSIADAIASLRRAGSGSAVQAAVERLRVDLVLTAHPTEAKRRTIRAKLRRVRAAMDTLDTEDILPRERREAMRVLEAELTAWWHTDLVRSTPPTVQDELNRGLLVARELWHVTPAVYRELHDAITGAGGDPGGASGPPLFLTFGSWIGGDRDGNPNVTAAVTEQTLLRLRREAAQLHLDASSSMLDTLSASTRRVGSGDIDKRVARLLERWPDAARELEAEHEHEAYRRFMVLVGWRLRRTLEAAQGAAKGGGGGYGQPAELLDDLRAVRRALCETGACAIAHDQLDDWIYRTQVFGLHLLALDVRQDGRVHREVIEELLQKAGVIEGWGSLPEEERIAALTRTLDTPLDTASLRLSPVAKETLATFEVIARTTTHFGARCVGGHVISMTQDASDVFAVLWLWTQTKRRLALDAPPLPIMPLFETIEDLRRAATVLQLLLKVPAYRDHLAKLGMRQTVMVGYSDSTKDGGYLAACWGLYRAQAELHTATEAAGVRLTFFHGRGGSLGRGGGPAARSIASLPEHTVDGAIRITEQGEVLAERYDDPQIAHRHLEQVVAATLLSGASKRPDESAWAQHMNRLRDRAHASYRALVEQDGFIDYFRAATPISEIERLQIGSRPPRRRSGTTLADLRAIPWVFAWTQSRHIIPAWYGVGAALEPDVGSPRELRALQAMYRKWAFFRATIDNAALALAKVDLAAAKRYAALAEPPHGPKIWSIIEEEYLRTRRCLLAVLDIAELLDDTPWLRASIARRNPYIAPLNALQVMLLRRIRETGDADAADLRDLARLTIHGVAAGMRTTG